jgi:hypothetical protein
VSPLDGELRIFGQIADGGDCEAIHDYSFDCRVARRGMIHPSRAGSLKGAIENLNAIKYRDCRDKERRASRTDFSGFPQPIL